MRIRNNIVNEPSGENVIKMPGKGAGKAAMLVILLLFLALTGYNSFYTLSEQQQAVVITFGRAETVTEPGLHFKIPYIQQVRTVTKAITGMPIGYDPYSNTSIPKESTMITGDFNIINVDFYVEYRIIDAKKALFASENYEKILKNMAQSYIRDTIGVYEIDDILTSGKAEIQAKIRELLSERMEYEDIGIQVLNVTIQDSELPTAEVASAFKDVENAKQKKDTLMNEANKYRSERMPAANAEADKLLKEAEAYKEERINEATGQVSRFNEMYQEYIKYPLITKQRMFYEMLEDVLPGKNIIIDNGNGTQKLLPLDSLTQPGVTNNEAAGEED